MTVDRSLTITPVDPPGGPLVIGLDDGQPQPSAGEGGWTEIARPRRRAAMEWTGHAAYRLTVSLLLDRGGAEDTGDDVEGDCEALRGLGLQVPGGHQPPVLTLAGPLYIPAERWVIQSIEWGAYLRRRDDGLRVRQAVSVEFWEHEAADLVVALSPAQAASQRVAEAAGQPTGAGTPVSRIYTARQGETLSAIAARELGDHRRWNEIADLNAIRDPRTLKVGQALTLPRPK